MTRDERTVWLAAFGATHSRIRVDHPTDTAVAARAAWRAVKALRDGLSPKVLKELGRDDSDNDEETLAMFREVQESTCG